MVPALHALAVFRRRLTAAGSGQVPPPQRLPAGPSRSPPAGADATSADVVTDRGRNKPQPISFSHEAYLQSVQTHPQAPVRVPHPDEVQSGTGHPPPASPEGPQAPGAQRRGDPLQAPHRAARSLTSWRSAAARKAAARPAPPMSTPHLASPAPAAAASGGAIGRSRLRLPKSHRLLRRGDFLAVKNHGRSQGGRFLVLGVQPVDGQDGFQLGLVTTRRCGGAVARNRIRRRLRELVRHDQGAIRPGHRFTLIARHTAAGATFDQLRREWRRLASRLGLLAPLPEHGSAADDRSRTRSQGSGDSNRGRPTESNPEPKP